MKINLNTSVEVTLSAHGAKAYNTHYKSYPRHCRPQTATTGTVLETQLWHVAHLFGHMMFMGSDTMPFVDNQVILAAGIEQPGWHVTTAAGEFHSYVRCKSEAKRLEAQGLTVEPVFKQKPL